jgi:hypothetical protein
MNNKTGKDIQINFYKAMAVLIVIYGYEKKNKKQKIKTPDMRFLKNVAGYIKRDHLRNIRIREELNVFNISNKILKSLSQWKYILRTEDRHIPKKTLTYHTVRRAPAVKTEEPKYISR